MYTNLLLLFLIFFLCCSVYSNLRSYNITLNSEIYHILVYMQCFIARTPPICIYRGIFAYIYVQMRCLIVDNFFNFFFVLINQTRILLCYISNITSIQRLLYSTTLYWASYKFIHFHRSIIIYYYCYIIYTDKLLYTYYSVAYTSRFSIF